MKEKLLWICAITKGICIDGFGWRSVDSLSMDEAVWKNQDWDLNNIWNNLKVKYVGRLNIVMIKICFFFFEKKTFHVFSSTWLSCDYCDGMLGLVNPSKQK